MVEKSEMSHKTPQQIRYYLDTIWVIAAKDVVDALKNRVVVPMIIMLTIVLLVPKLLPLIFDQPQVVVPVYDMGDSRLVAELTNAGDVSVKKVRSEQEWQATLCGAPYPLIGLRIAADFDHTIGAGGPAELQGFACWGKRHQLSESVPRLEGILSRVLGRPVIIHVQGNIVYPLADGVPLLSLATVNSVLLILMMGIFLVPSLLFEEKETKTLQALLVSPASIGQVVVAKALAGLFYILVTVMMIYAISWADVTHWGAVVLLLIGGGVFSVAVGLVLGSYFEKQQDTVGWMTALLLLLVGAALAYTLGMELPALVGCLLPWVPSVALAAICHASFSETVSTARIVANLAIVLAVSLPLYVLVIWRVRRSDR